MLFLAQIHFVNVSSSFIIFCISEISSKRYLFGKGQRERDRERQRERETERQRERERKKKERRERFLQCLTRLSLDSLVYTYFINVWHLCIRVMKLSHFTNRIWQRMGPCRSHIWRTFRLTLLCCVKYASSYNSVDESSSCFAPSALFGLYVTTVLVSLHICIVKLYK